MLWLKPNQTSIRSPILTSVFANSMVLFTSSGSREAPSAPLFFVVRRDAWSLATNAQCSCLHLRRRWVLEYFRYCLPLLGSTILDGNSVCMHHDVGGIKLSSFVSIYLSNRRRSSFTTLHEIKSMVITQCSRLRTLDRQPFRQHQSPMFSSGWSLLCLLACFHTRDVPREERTAPSQPLGAAARQNRSYLLGGILLPL